MEPKRDEKYALKIVKWWAESQLKVKKDFRQSLLDALEKHLFYVPSSIVAGLYDYGQNGLVLEHHVLEFWDQHFFMEDGMLDCYCPDAVLEASEAALEASGLADKFTDYTVKHDKTRELNHIVAVLNGICAEQVDANNEYDIEGPDTRNPLFENQIDASTEYKCHATEHSMYDVFYMLHGINQNKLPVTAATTRKSVRTEISPRQDLFRPLTLALIEHFHDPDDKAHAKYFEVSSLEFLMFPKEEQMSGESAKRLCLGEAVTKGIVNNQTLAYFIARVYLFLTRLGIDEKRLRFRQRLPDVMDHYAEDGWLAEIESSYGWIECVWIADRSVSDLEKNGVTLVALEEMAQPTEVEVVVIKPVYEELRPAFKGDCVKVVEALETMDQIEVMEMESALESNGEVEFEVCTLGKTVAIKKTMVSILKEYQLVDQRLINSAVMGSSFSIGRIICCLFEHTFYTRPSEAGDEKINAFCFLPLVAPVKCYILSVIQDQQYEEVAEHISRSLFAAEVQHEKRISGSSSVEKRYAIADEYGVPFTIMVVSTSSVTISERDSKDQIIVSVEEVVELMKKLSMGESTWADVLKTYPAYSNQLP